MKISNLINEKGNSWNNQIIIQGQFITGGNVYILQSYQSKVVMIDEAEQRIDFADDWDYSNTTRRAVYKFLQDFVGFGFKLERKTIVSALELGVIKDSKGRVWNVSPACDEFFEVLEAIK